MNVELEILKAVVEMVKMGGTYTIVAIISYFLMQIIKLSIVWGFIWVIIRLLAQSILGYMDKRLNSKMTSFQAFSDKSVEHLMKTLDEFSKQNQAILIDLEKRLKDLSENSRIQTKETVSPKS